MYLTLESLHHERRRGEDEGLLLAVLCIRRVEAGWGQEALDWLSFSCLLHYVAPSVSLKYELSALPVVQHNSLCYLAFSESPLGEH